MKSKTTMLFIAILIAILVLLFAVVCLPTTQRALASVYYSHGFSLNNLPCVWIHGGHVHCTEVQSVGTERALASVYYSHGFSLNNLPCVWIHGGHVHCE